MNLIIDRAQKTDVDELMALYFLPAQITLWKSAPIKPLCRWHSNNPKMAEHFQWYVMRDMERHALAGSASLNSGLSLVSDWRCRGENYRPWRANRLIEHAANAAFEKHDVIPSIPLPELLRSL